jgi:glycerophosphoryl diester phosphodiesterase
MTTHLWKFLAVAAAAWLSAGPLPACAGEPARPIVIAHRGASGYLPEHTLEAYTLAHALGADFIEPDLVMTRDGALICLHDIHLEATTDAAARFPKRARADGRWYAADFSLAEIKALAVHERVRRDGLPVFPGRFRVDSKGFQVPTLVETIELVQALNHATGRAVGLYPETKDPAFHNREGLSLEAPLLATLAAYGYTGADSRIFIQSFDPRSLQKLRFGLGTKLSLVQLIGGGPDFDPLVTGEGLEAIAAYANGIGPAKTRIETAPGRPVGGNSLVERAHALNLAVHPYTFRADVLAAGDADLESELQRFLWTYGVDGFFTDHPDRGRRVVEGLAGQTSGGRTGDRIGERPGSRTRP